MAESRHACTLSRTNSYATVAVCKCGWTGSVHPTPAAPRANGNGWRRNFELSQAHAIAEYERHLKESRPLTATMPAEQFAGVVINTKRFGHA